MLSFDEEVVEFSLHGKKHSIKVPNNEQIQKYQKDLAACEDEKKGELLIAFFGELGLSKESYGKLSQGQTAKLLKALYGAEKN